MDFARFEYQSEATYIFGILKNHGTGAVSINVDGVSTAPTERTGWFWTKTRYPISYPMAWGAGFPTNSQNACLRVFRDATGAAGGFANIPCGGASTRLVLCQIVHENFLHRIMNGRGK